jgi:hypothetical protein
MLLKTGLRKLRLTKSKEGRMAAALYRLASMYQVFMYIDILNTDLDYYFNFNYLMQRPIDNDYIVNFSFGRYCEMGWGGGRGFHQKLPSSPRILERRQAQNFLGRLCFLFRPRGLGVLAFRSCQHILYLQKVHFPPESLKVFPHFNSGKFS